jgi:hypothetical protein
VIDPIDKLIGRRRDLVTIPMICAAAIAWLGWPQLAFTLASGRLSRRFEVTVSRR